MQTTVNDAQAYGVSVQPAEVGVGHPYWRLTRIHHLTGEENLGHHHLYLDVLDEYGKPAAGVTVRVRWTDGEADVTTADAGPEEAGASVAMVEGQVYSVEIAGLPSDAALDLHPDHPEEGPGRGNRLHRHSFRLTWQRSLKKVFAHYVLFGPPGDPQTQANLVIALGYVLRFKPAFGFKPEEAALAERVTIIGGPDIVPYDVQDQLEQAGCWVHRIEGDSRAVDRVLSDLHRRGQPFP